MPWFGAGDARTLGGKEDAMYLSIGVVLVIAVLVLSPVLWVAWWALADMGERATGSYSHVHHVQPA
jgi:hypothetical protein